MNGITYKARPVYYPMLFLPILLVIGAVEGGIQSNEWTAIIGAFLFLAFFFFYSFLMRINIDSNGVLTTYHFIYIKGLQYSAKDIVAMEYGNLFKGGLGAGKGLNIIIKKNGREINTSIGEDLFGKEAIQQIQAVLTKKSTSSQ